MMIKLSFLVVTLMLILRHVHGFSRRQQVGRLPLARNLGRTIKQPHAAAPRCMSSSSGENQNLWSVEECLDLHFDARRPSVFVDATFFHKGEINGRSAFAQGPRIPRAQFFDMTDLVTCRDYFPNLNPKGLALTFPPLSMFAAAMDAMGITHDHQVIVYGQANAYFTPRAWYMMKTYGGPKQRVGLMQGSLQDWMEAGGPVDHHPISYDIWAKDLIQQETAPKYPVDPDATKNLVGLSKVLQILDENASQHQDSSTRTCTQIVDTRGSSFAKGHMPGAIHIPYSSLVTPDNTLKLKSKEELNQIFETAGLNKDKPILLTCGSCVSVCHMALALEECGYSSTSSSNGMEPLLYEGSWSEYGKEPDTVKVTSTTNARAK